MSTCHPNEDWVTSNALSETLIPETLIISDITNAQRDEKVFKNRCGMDMYPHCDNPYVQNIYISKEQDRVIGWASCMTVTEIEMLIHYFAQEGTKQVIYAGFAQSCHHQIKPGDHFIVNEACLYPVITAAQNHTLTIDASFDGIELNTLLNTPNALIHYGRTLSCDQKGVNKLAVFDQCIADRCWVKDTYSGAIFALAKKYGLHRFSILAVTDIYSANASDTQSKTKSELHNELYKTNLIRLALTTARQ